MKPTAFPLCWPASQPRTKSPRRAAFQISAASARADLLDELRKLRARAVVLSTNLPLRRDGLPMVDGNPVAAGVAVYFEIAGGDRGVEHVIACDAWDRVKDNMRAISKTVEAIRGIERWGSSRLMAQVFSAFKMLPATGSARPWRDVMGLVAGNGYTLKLDDARDAYRKLARVWHPDVEGGSHEKMAELNAAMAAAEAELGGAR